eukprot:GFYU01032672.1.p1 GENE.GFYU01032672.1~~GFYU01032672.1.p1  ORF type:complete len:271 (+),score=81.10 GFYU01032672.1:87-899(+)
MTKFVSAVVSAAVLLCTGFQTTHAENLSDLFVRTSERLNGDSAVSAAAGGRKLSEDARTYLEMKDIDVDPIVATGVDVDVDVADPETPRWPDTFSATLAKVNPNDDNIVWTKLYYDWTFSKGGAARFDFYNKYVDNDANWSLNCTVTFVDSNIWFIFPGEKACKHRSSSLPSINPNWISLLGARFNGYKAFRGMMSEEWHMPDPDEPSYTMRYFASAKSNDIPLRSPNQINDPGNTDFFDVNKDDPIDTELFAVPDYCQTNQIDKGCPWY